MSLFELGGFAESKDVLDGTEEEFNAFNYCLAIGLIMMEKLEKIK